MTHYWEIRFFVLLALGVLAVVVWEVGKVWLTYRRQWRQVPRYYGRPYDASVRSGTPRPNVRRA